MDARGGGPLWVFGYGSLIYRPDLPWRTRHVATLHGWARRFWQGSPDHRGTEEAPGRVVTLVEQVDAQTVGLLYEVTEGHAAGVLARLDHREQAGFERWVAPVELREGGVVHALVYRASEHNPSFLGAAPLGAMAQQIARCHGPSGTNAAYLLELDAALADLGVHDAHVRTLAEAVRRVL